MTDRRTLREWFAYLDSDSRDFTVTEFMALMLFNQREYLRMLRDEVHDLALRGEHTEAMLGSLDILASNIAAMNGLPYAASHEVRAALDAARDDARRLAARTRSRARETASAAPDGPEDG